ncbi:MAG TPA: hypothetical protein DHV36_06565 [Desulfobacteraceae bacterium]|nr:hypothetical protein [Desulfobacteraceae bacterium]|tara:strand:- start:678 stop:992 length:315 start_codon:yes stop_codon:yes gene_type:complete
MKLTEGMQLIAEGWIVKPEGFRVKFQQMTNGELVTGYSPPETDTPLDSDVTTWRYAWKLAMAASPEGDELHDGCLVNVTVVDEKGSPIRYYATGKPEIFNPSDI